MREFVDQVYVPDTLAIAGLLQGLVAQGEVGNFLCYGEFPPRAWLTRRRSSSRAA